MTQVAWPQEKQEFREEQSTRHDSIKYCPRVDKEILILDSRCFYSGRDEGCQGCVFDADFINVRLILIMSEILQERLSKERT